MHMLTEVRILNFRSCINCTAPLAAYTPMVGPNNAGKSNIISAIKWAMSGSVLEAKDFNSSASEVVVGISITGVTPEILAALPQNHRTAITPYCPSGHLILQRVQPRPSCPKKDIILQVLDPATGSWEVNPTGLDNAIKALFPEPVQIPAMQDCAEDVTKSKSSSTIGKLLALVTQAVSDTHAEEINQRLDAIKDILAIDGQQRSAKLAEVDDSASQKLQDFFPGLKIQIHLPPPELQEIFKSGTIKALENGSNDHRDISSLGHGAQRAIQMALLRHLAEIQQGVSGRLGNTLLLIDEPELYLHPQGVKILCQALKKLSANGYQVLFSTHSPIMIESTDIADALIIRKTDAGTAPLKSMRQELAGLFSGDTESQAEVLFSLSHSSEVLFSDTIFLVEGKTEEKLLPRLFEHVRGHSLAGARTALVPLGGSGGISKSMKVLNALGVPTKAVTDFDFIFKTPLTRTEPEFQALTTFLTGRGINIPSAGDIPKTLKKQAWEAINSDSAALDNIQKLHDKMKAHGIWIWYKGDIEQHLGITEGKNPAVWSRYLADVEARGLNAVAADADSVIALFEWLAPTASSRTTAVQQGTGSSVADAA